MCTMATIVNTPQSSDSNGIGMLIALFLVIVVGFLFFYYGLPAIGNMTGGSQINIPSKIDVNINQQK